ncbi:ADP-forming succinate--CoA ligase subunit beta [Methanofollis formosanus]|uniref:Succinate--CoA ligase [ADP-forming] subunit beta n=1 Tax=Methanofollis formosanus TaxID=299308 RepID=A0A8G1A3V2_9EURY|nr:ADP-forming succinate--CoA ligase subunit beta [Methanofollis formosanus]QYZ80095.1 ADP-forming succinate--CoA ligase subunit beta [Methanofollis formosanus]
MKLLEFEAKELFKQHGIQVPRGVLISDHEEAVLNLRKVGPNVVVKAQVDVGGRGKAGGVLMADTDTAVIAARELFAREIKGVKVARVLIEERLDIQHEYYVSITIDRSTKHPVVLFADTGGVNIEETAKTNPDAIRKVSFTPLLRNIPRFLLRELIRDAPAEVGETINKLYHVFCDRDALLAEINPLVTTPQGVYAADAKLIIDDNALARQEIAVNRDLTRREREAERHGFSYVELDGSIGVIGNGAGLTMSTLDLIEHFGGKAANFLDVGGGADKDRVKYAVELVADMPDVKVIIVNLLGGITRCDEVARGIIEAGVEQPVIVRLAGTNEKEGKEILAGHGYQMLGSMDEAVKAAVEVTA